jgi:predicted Ser/Thr protein kinase
LRVPDPRSPGLSRRRPPEPPAIEPELETWLREHLESRGRVIGHGYQAVVRQIESEDGVLVVKSPHPNPLLAWFGRRAIRREARIYDRLEDVPGVPHSLGLADSEHLVLEHVRGTTLRQAASQLEDREAFFDRLLESIVAMHAAGVAHGDLKRKENTLVRADGSPCIIDFGVACLRRGGLHHFNRIRFEQTRQMDLNAYIKLKYGPFTDQMSARDSKLYRPLLIERLARLARGPWKFLTLRRLRKNRRARRDAD